MKRKIASLALALSMLSGVVSAEQPKAAEYRSIMSSGTFYLEYESGFAKQSLAVQGDRRMSYTIHKNKGLNPLSFVPVVGMFAAFMQSEDQVPNALYQDGKYYHFLSKKEALVADGATLRDPHLDPEEGWTSIKNDLTFPEVFAIFAPNDPLNTEVHYQVPKFVESGTEKKDGKEMLYDKYVKQNMSSSGADLGNTVYYVYYNQKGDLARIKTKFQMGGQEEELPYSEIKVLKISAELPDKIIGIPEECKIFAAGIGDMNDLLDHHVPVDGTAN